jgi:hypothetical protein
VGTDRALFFLNAMFGDPEPLDWQIHHLTPLWQCCWLAAQIVLAVLAACDRMNEYLIRHLDLLEVMPTVAFLPTGLLAALLPQALGRTHKPIGGGRQTTIMAIFGLLPFESFDTLLQILNGHDGLFEAFA